MWVSNPNSTPSTTVWPIYITFLKSITWMCCVKKRNWNVTKKSVESKTVWNYTRDETKSVDDSCSVHYNWQRRVGYEHHFKKELPVRGWEIKLACWKFNTEWVRRTALYSWQNNLSVLVAGIAVVCMCVFLRIKSKSWNSCKESALGFD